MKVFVNKKIGFFIDVIKLDDNEYSNIVDLKIIVSNDVKVYFKTSSYDILPKGINIYFLEDYYYCDVNDIFNIYSIFEFGEYIYGDDIDYVLNNAIGV